MIIEGFLLAIMGLVLGHNFLNLDKIDEKNQKKLALNSSIKKDKSHSTSDKQEKFSDDSKKDSLVSKTKEQNSNQNTLKKFSNNSREWKNIKSKL